MLVQLKKAGAVNKLAFLTKKAFLRLFIISFIKCNHFSVQIMVHMDANKQMGSGILILDMEVQVNQILDSKMI